MKKLIIIALVFILSMSTGICHAETVTDIATAAGYTVTEAVGDGSFFTDESIQELVEMGKVICQADITEYMQMLVWTENGTLYGIGDGAFDGEYDITKMHNVFEEALTLDDWDVASLSISTTQGDSINIGYSATNTFDDNTVFYPTLEEFINAVHEELNQ